MLPVARPAVFSCFLSRPKSTSPENQNQLAPRPPRPPPDKSGASDQGCHPPSQLPAPVPDQIQTLALSVTPTPDFDRRRLLPRPRQVTSKDFELASLQPTLITLCTSPYLPTSLPSRFNQPHLDRDTSSLRPRITIRLFLVPGGKDANSISPPGFRRRTRRRRDSRPTATAARLVVPHDSQLFAMRNEIT